MAQQVREREVRHRPPLELQQRRQQRLPQRILPRYPQLHPLEPRLHRLQDKRVQGPPEQEIAAEVEADGAAVFQIQRPQRRQHGRRIQTILQNFSMNPLRMASFKHWWLPSGLRIRRWQ